MERMLLNHAEQVLASSAFLNCIHSAQSTSWTNLVYLPFSSMTCGFVWGGWWLITSSKLSLLSASVLLIDRFKALSCPSHFKFPCLLSWPYFSTVQLSRSLLIQWENDLCEQHGHFYPVYCSAFAFSWVGMYGLWAPWQKRVLPSTKKLYWQTYIGMLGVQLISILTWPSNSLLWSCVILVLSSNFYRLWRHTGSSLGRCITCCTSSCFVLVLVQHSTFTAWPLCCF